MSVDIKTIYKGMGAALGREIEKLKARATPKHSMRMVARAKRRNAARRAHELHAWKRAENRVALPTGQAYVLYPLVSVR